MVNNANAMFQLVGARLRNYILTKLENETESQIRSVR